MELQVMPTAVHLLRVDQYVDHARHPAPDDGLDFATLIVYTCKRQCGAVPPTEVAPPAASTGGVRLQVGEEYMLVEPAPSLQEDLDAAHAGGMSTMREVAGMD
jgi:hypothetical protein